MKPYETIPVGSQIRCNRTVTVESRNHDFHLHDVYEIYLFLRGDVNYFVENSVYPLRYGDLLFFNNYEIQRAAFQSNKLYERVVIHFPPDLMEPLSTENTRLLSCFREHPLGERNRIHLEEPGLFRFLRIYNQLEKSVRNTGAGYGQDVLARAYLAELLVLINSIYNEEEEASMPETLSEATQELLDYIDHHLGDTLTLEELEKHFLVNRYSLCRRFKEETGTTIYNHILNRRISMAKLLLSEGKSVTEVCHDTGFGDYSNFIRTFKRITGYTPLKFQKQGQR